MTDYLDLDMGMKRNLYNDIDIKTDIKAIEQSLIDILLTRIGEREEMPTYGSKLFETLMQKMSNITTIGMKEDITSALNNWEPRIRIISISINPVQEEYTYYISIKVNIVRINIETEFNITLESIQ